MFGVHNGHAAGTCWEAAGQTYGISPTLLMAIADVESGMKPNAVNKNSNGTRDIGLMQINSSWLPTLRRHGIVERDLYNPCVSVHVGAWILAANVQQYGPTWQAIGAYNAKSTSKQIQYAKRVMARLGGAPKKVDDAHREKTPLRIVRQEERPRSS